MKSLKSTLATALLVLFSMSTYAGNTDKTVEKARDMVSNAAPDDYKTLADAAALCVRKDANLTQAKEWFEKSIEIKANSKAYEVAGDYYSKNNLKEKAIDAYIQSMLLAKQENFNADTKHLESKISELKK